jgi:hypothetical protein
MYPDLHLSVTHSKGNIEVARFNGTSHFATRDVEIFSTGAAHTYFFGAARIDSEPTARLTDSKLVECGRVAVLTFPLSFSSSNLTLFYITCRRLNFSGETHGARINPHI